MKRISGIYCIINLINNKKYVGSSINIHKRWKDHLYALKIGTHRNEHLQHAWNKYNEESFKFIILEEIEASEPLKLFPKEDEWMVRMNTLDPIYGYNKELAGNKVTSSSNGNRVLRKVVVLDKQGNFIKEYISIAEVERDLEISAKRIDYLLNNRTIEKKRKSYKGYQFIYKDNYDPSKNYQWEYQGRSIPIVQLDDQFNVLGTFKNVRDAAEKLNLNNGTICTAIHRKHKCGGFHFRKYREDGIYEFHKSKQIPAKFVVVEGQEFSSTREAMLYYGIEQSRYKYIKACIRKGRSIYGKTWKFKE